VSFEKCCEVIENRGNHRVKTLIKKLTNKNFILAFMNRLKNFIEWQAFGVCSALGEKMGIATSRIRMWFMYISFLTLGSPIILYMVIAFWMNIKRYILSARRNPLRYL
jgi:phage shock protein PspC (stress-responsive transcriptional regulator)